MVSFVLDMLHIKRGAIYSILLQQPQMADVCVGDSRQLDSQQLGSIRQQRPKLMHLLSGNFSAPLPAVSPLATSKPLIHVEEILLCLSVTTVYLGAIDVTLRLLTVSFMFPENELPNLLPSWFIRFLCSERIQQL